MLKRVLVIWLIVSTLGYGSVWAFDGHINEASEHSAVVDGAGDAPDDGGVHHACDHCCHASAHVMGLSPFQSSTGYAGSCIGATPYRYTLPVLSTTPPDRPPRS